KCGLGRVTAQGRGLLLGLLRPSRLQASFDGMFCGRCLPLTRQADHQQDRRQDAGPSPVLSLHGVLVVNARSMHTVSETDEEGRPTWAQKEPLRQPVRRRESAAAEGRLRQGALGCSARSWEVVAPRTMQCLLLPR